jgi:hypothetical protein
MVDSTYQIAKDIANIELRIAQLTQAVEELYIIVKPKEVKQ